jgi:hypothetical protein
VWVGHRGTIGLPKRARTGIVGLAILVVSTTTFGLTGASAVPSRDSRGCARQHSTTADFFARMVKNRTDDWLAGDSPGSVDLHDGRVLWLFGDTWVGGRAPDGTFTPATRLWHNSALLQTGQCVDFVGASGTGWLQLPSTLDWWWPTAGFVRGSAGHQVVDIFVDRERRTGPGTFGFTPLSVEVVELRASDLAVLGVRPLRYQNRLWAAASVVADGRWLYLFSREYQTGPFTYVARASARDPFGAWQFWTGRTWSSDPSHGAPVLTYPPFNNPQISRIGPNRWLALAKDREHLGTTVIGWTARRPQGPWRPTGPLIAAPTTGRPGEFTYLAAAHPEINVGRGRLLISWNINTQDLTLSQLPSGNYGPRFAVIRLPAAILSE